MRGEKRESKRAEIIRPTVFILSTILLVIGAWLWGFESWMLPGVFRRWPTTHILAVIWAGASGLLVAAAWCRGTRRRCQRIAVAGIAIASLCYGLRWLGGTLALDRMCQYDKLGNPQKENDPALWRKLESTLHSTPIPVPKWLKKRTENQWSDPPKLWHWVECSRWPVRRRFVERAMSNPNQARELAERWNVFFPVVTGADVELRNRRQLMETLDEIRQNKSALPEARATAVFWMGLIVLSDAPEFSQWRETVRDAMMQCPNPPLGDEGDAWMRTLDVLLAFDPPEKWKTLTAPLTTDPDTLRRAVRQRLRGMIHHADAIIAEVNAAENAKDRVAAFSLWQDVGRMIHAWPEIHPTKRMVTWQRDTIYRWLLDWRWYGSESILNPHDNPALKLLPEQRQQLTIEAMAAAERSIAANAQAKSSYSKRTLRNLEYQRVRLLYPYLTQESQMKVAREIGPVLIQQHMRAQDGTNQDVNFLLEAWPHLADCDRASYGKEFRKDWESSLASPELLALDRWSPQPGLSDKEWLITALATSVIYFSADYRFKIVASEELPSKWWTKKPLPIPPVEAKTKSWLLAWIDGIAIGNHWSMDRVPRSRLVKFSIEGYEDTLLPRWLAGELERLLQNHDRTALPPGIEFKGNALTHLWLSGLLEPDDHLYEVFTRAILRNDLLTLASWRRAHVSDPWQRVLSSQERTREVFEHLLREPDSLPIPLLGILSTMLRQPPSPEVRATVWRMLRQRSNSGEQGARLEAFGAMFRISPLMSREQRIEMRKEFLRYFASTPISQGEWPVNPMREIITGHSFGTDEGIPWEDDGLSAALSWSSKIKAETKFTYGYGESVTRSGVFSYITQAFAPFHRYPDWLSTVPPLPTIREPTVLRKWRRDPLRLPLEATPWQNARALHLRRPDLKWPDRAWYRPKQSKN